MKTYVQVLEWKDMVKHLSVKENDEARTYGIWFDNKM